MLRVAPNPAKRAVIERFGAIPLASSREAGFRNRGAMC